MSENEKFLPTTETLFIERIAQRLGIAADAKRIYGEPVERDGVTVIPVAKVIYGFGGGSGWKKESEQGAGGGGGVVVTPVGYIEIKRGETRFRPARDPLALVPAILATAEPVILLAVWAFRKLRRNEVKK